MSDDCNVVGQTGEAAVAAQLAAAGFHVYAPIFCKPESDLIAELGGKLVRFQVKTLAGNAPALRFPTWTASTGSYVGLVDWFAFHSLHHGITAFLKPEEAGTRPTLHYDDIDDPFHENKSTRYASDYALGRVIKEILT